MTYFELKIKGDPDTDELGSTAKLKGETLEG
jgi:hypothetical protein